MDSSTTIVDDASVTHTSQTEQLNDSFLLSPSPVSRLKITQKIIDLNLDGNGLNDSSISSKGNQNESFIKKESQLLKRSQSVGGTEKISERQKMISSMTKLSHWVILLANIIKIFYCHLNL